MYYKLIDNAGQFTQETDKYCNGTSLREPMVGDLSQEQIDQFFRQTHNGEPAPFNTEPTLMRGYRLSDLLHRQFEPLHYLSEPLISEGLTIFAGRPKIGKTTLVRQLLISLSASTPFLGYPCVETKSLFLCLEEGERMAQRKFKRIVGDSNVSLIDIRFEWARGIDGLLDIRQYLAENPDVRLVVIDSLSRFREVQTRNTNQFQQDYEMVSSLHTLTKDFPKLAIVILHHTTKAKADDPMDCISGTYGITAAVDSYGVLLKSGDKYRLHWGGRNWDSDVSDFEVARKDGKWELIGEWDNNLSGLTAVQQNVIEVLKSEGTVSCTGLSRRLEITKQSALEHLKKLTNLGVIVRRGNDYSLT